MNKKIKFWIEAISWAIFGYVIPIGAFVWKFNLLDKTPKTSWGLVGIICLIIAFGFLNTVSKYIEAGTTDVRVSQCITGFRKKILPMICLWGFAYLLKDNIEVFLDVMGVVILSVLISLPINPFPQWIKDNQTEEQKKVINSTFKKIAKFIWGKEN